MNAIPKIYALGTRHNTDIFHSSVAVEEKIDGSQFSFCYTDGVLVCRSKSVVITGDPGMFQQAVETVTALASEGKLAEMNGWVFQCEYLQRPKHNVLKYDRIPAGHLVLFDVRLTTGMFLNPGEKQNIARMLGLEPVPVLYAGLLAPTQEWLDGFLQSTSVLGGCKVEGIVIKNYSLPHPESQSGSAPMTAKVVSEAFKEKKCCAPRNPKQANEDLVPRLTAALRTEARWFKAIQHLKEAGQLNNEEKDIGPLVREIQRDVLDEESDWIKEKLFEEFSKGITKGVVQGFAQYYKSLLNNGMSVWQETVLGKKD